MGKIPIACPAIGVHVIAVAGLFSPCQVRFCPCKHTILTLPLSSCSALTLSCWSAVGAVNPCRPAAQVPGNQRNPRRHLMPLPALACQRCGVVLLRSGPRQMAGKDSCESTKVALSLSLVQPSRAEMANCSIAPSAVGAR